MNLQKMMQQAQAMQTKVAEMQARMEAQEEEGSSGGGMVSVRINGKNQLLSVTIDPSLMKPDEKDMLEDLIVAAYRDAREKVDANAEAEMKKLSGSLNLPPGFKLPF